MTGITAHPTGSWVVQQARNLTMALDDRVQPVKFLSVTGTPSSPRASTRFSGRRHSDHPHPGEGPRANAFAERFVGTVRRECLDRILIFGHRHLERALAEYVVHYNEHRPHRALYQLAPLASTTTDISDPDPGNLRRRNSLFGLIHEYRLAA